jgi:hypothetical protein
MRVSKNEITSVHFTQITVWTRVEMDLTAEFNALSMNAITETARAPCEEAKICVTIIRAKIAGG